MENKVIEVLDYMGEKLGIAIDWTSENVMPQVMAFLGRYQVYSIVSDSVWVLISIIIVFVSARMIKKIVKQLNGGEGFWWENDDFGLFVIIVCAVAFIICAIVALCNVFEIIKWSFVPEMKFFETLSAYLKSA